MFYINQQAMMYLTKLHENPSRLLDADLCREHEEMEIMLEAYLDAMRGICNRLQLLYQEVSDAVCCFVFIFMFVFHISTGVV